MAGNSSPDKPQVFRSPTAVIVWIVWLLFAVANWVDLAVQGRDHASAVAAAILLLATGAAYVTAQRPRIIADQTGVTVRNPLRDHRIGWASVTKVDLADMLRVHTQGGPGGWGAPGGRGGSRGSPRRASRPAQQGHHRLGYPLLPAAQVGRRGPGPPRGQVPGATALVPGPGVRRPRPVLRRSRVSPRSLRRRGRSGEDRPGAQRARDHGPGRGRLGQRHGGGRRGRNRHGNRDRQPGRPHHRPGRHRPAWWALGPSRRRARGAAGPSPPSSFPR